MIFQKKLKCNREAPRKSRLPPPDDPCDVVHTILQFVGSAAYYTKIVPILSSSKIRKDTDQLL